MSAYENHIVPEGINVSPQSPLKELFVLVAGVSLMVATMVVALSLVAEYLAPWIPFEKESAIAARADRGWTQTTLSDSGLQKQQYLQALADRLAANMDLPPEMKVVVHYSPDKTINAFAMLGGNIVVFQGLLDTLPNENALAMVLAHEIAHVRGRHPIVSLGRGITVALALSAISGVGDGITEKWLGSMGLLTINSFSRSQEQQADAEAMQALYRTYGHIDGAEAFFTRMADKQGFLTPPALLSTHPGNQERITSIRQFAKEHAPKAVHELQPLPSFIALDR